jgi:hypothetical protein
MKIGLSLNESLPHFSRIRWIEGYLIPAHGQKLALLMFVAGVTKAAMYGIQPRVSSPW